MQERNRPRWRSIDEETIRIDGWRRPEPTQAINGDTVQVVVQLPTRSPNGRKSILMTPEIAVQIGQQLIEAANDILGLSGIDED